MASPRMAQPGGPLMGGGRGGGGRGRGGGGLQQQALALQQHHPQAVCCEPECPYRNPVLLTINNRSD
jgi:hypothetical protein